MAYSRTLNHFTSMQELATIWASSTSYVVNQLVIQSDKLYRCLVAHTSGGTFIADLQAAYWVEISASEAGVFNYIGNPDAEVDTSGWSSYAESDAVTFQDTGDTVTLNNHGLSNNAEISFTSITSTTGISVNTRYFVVSATTNTFQVASSSGGSALPLTTNGSGTMVRFVPKTGSGGSANITWSRSITSPLRGDADFNLVKDAANRQGQGVEYDFTIDNADLAKVLTVTFDYEVVSGTLATGDVTVYLIQDPSGTPLVIQPAGYQVQGATVGTKMRQIATFQTSSTVTSYRLCLHVSSVSASAYTLAIDNVIVGPQVVQYGAPVTDWVSFTPTGSWTNNTTYTGQYRRVGDELECEVLLALSGAPNAVSLTVNLPAGLSIDTAKLISTNANYSFLGNSRISDATGSGRILGDISYQSTTSVNVFHLISGSNAFSVVNATNPITFAASDRIVVSFRAPILGWSSTVQMSNDTDTRVVAFSARDSSSQTVTSSNSTAQWNTVILDTHGAFNSATNEYVVQVPGVYSISAGQNVSATIDVYVSVFVNGVQLGSGSFASRKADIKVTGNLKAGDKITIMLSVVGGPTTRIANYGYFNIERLSGPSAIAASETVAASYWLPASQSSGTTTPINFSSRQFDSHGAVTTGSAWKFTAPIAGTYNVTIFAYISGGVSAAYNLYKNGVLYTEIAEQIPNQVGIGSLLIQLVAGDYLDLRTGATQTVYGSTFNTFSAKFHIHRIGN